MFDFLKRKKSAESTEAPAEPAEKPGFFTKIRVVNPTQGKKPGFCASMRKS